MTAAVRSMLAERPVQVIGNGPGLGSDDSSASNAQSGGSYARAATPAPRHVRPSGAPPRPVSGGGLFRWVRTRNVPGVRTWRPWWLLGLVEVVTFPLPRYATGQVLYVPGIAASCGLPARPALLALVAL